MATRSVIGIVNLDKSITGIYCHYDGYPENNGKILLNHYTDADWFHMRSEEHTSDWSSDVCSSDLI